MRSTDPILIDIPLPILTPRLLIRSKQPGDGALTAAAVAETWSDLHQWMDWAESLQDNTAEKQEIRTRQVMATFLLRQEFNFVGVEIATGQPVIWCGFHSVNWLARHCDTGYWVRRSAQGRGFATEATNALLRYAFGPMGMQRVGLTHAEGNERSRRVAEKLGFTPEGVQRAGSQLPGGRIADKRLYARLNTDGLPDLTVHWGAQADAEQSACPTEHLRSLEDRLLDPDVRRNPASVAALLTDDFREFGSSGRSFSKTAILEALATEAPSALRLTDFACHPLSADVALVTYRSHRQNPDGTSATSLRSSLWRCTDDGWRMRFHQGTREQQGFSTA